MHTPNTHMYTFTIVPHT